MPTGDDDKYYSQGWNAAYKGYTKKDNPYKRYTHEWEQWREGNIMSHNDDLYWSNLKNVRRKIKRKS